MVKEPIQIIGQELIVGIGCVGQQDYSPIVFGELNWTSAQLQNAIARRIVEKGYGCRTDIIPGGAIPLWDSLFEGNVQVLMEAWLPNYNQWWEKGLSEGSIIPLGNSLDENWQSAFVVPKYVVTLEVL